MAAAALVTAGCGSGHVLESLGGRWTVRASIEIESGTIEQVLTTDFDNAVTDGQGSTLTLRASPTDPENKSFCDVILVASESDPNAISASASECWLAIDGTKTRRMSGVATFYGTSPEGGLAAGFNVNYLGTAVDYEGDVPGTAHARAKLIVEFEGPVSP